MKSRFNSEQDANEYMVTHQIYNRVAIPLSGSKKWGLVFPLECHVTKRQPHSQSYVLSQDRKLEEDYDDGEVVGLDSDGQVVCWNAKETSRYTCGDTLSDYGLHNLRECEISRVGVGRDAWEAACAEHRKLQQEQQECDLPVVLALSVYHIGTLDQNDRGIGGASQEGHCLSVSLCPEAWREIAKLGAMKPIRLDNQPGMFLDILRALESDSIVGLAREMAVADGLAELRTVFRSWEFDDESEEWRYMLHESRGAAVAQIDGLYESVDTAGPDEGPAVEPVECYAGTAKLADLLGVPTRDLLDCDDFLLLVWAERTQPQLSGVWWNETFAPHLLSAPRGAIFPERIKDWQIHQPVVLDDDDVLLESAKYGEWAPANYGRETASEPRTVIYDEETDRYQVVELSGELQ